MLVEFIGAAGAGKSFLSELVLDALRARRISARNFDLIEINRASPNNLVLMARAVYLGMMTWPQKPSQLMRAIGDIARYSIRCEICERIDGMHITSEGLFHRIIGFHRNSRKLGMDQIAEMLFSRIQPPAVVVVVEADVQNVFARRTDRNRTNDIFSLESVEADIAIVKECVATMEIVRRVLHTPLQIVRADTNEEGGATAVAEIVAVLESLAGYPPTVAEH